MTDGIDLTDFNTGLTVKELQKTNCSEVPTEKGIYVIHYNGKGRPDFLETSVGGWFKGKDPTCTKESLEINWIDGASILYIGKAGGKNGLKERLLALARFGLGKPVAHRGGRLIWQIKSNKKLLVCWKKEERPRAVEKKLILDFEEGHGRLPFANLQR